ncbi:MAG: hypothetical protein IIA41_05310 [SAR324 cluster bacterium]|nr:hypothetical protein [SAR324 cluster bacterium]
MYLHGSHRLTFVSVLSLGIVGLSACVDDSTGPDDPQFIAALSVADLQETLDSGSIRVAITVASDGTVAREVEIRASGATDAEASIESTVTGFELQRNQTLLLTLAPGNLFVRVGAETRLFGDHNDELDFGSFVVRLGKALSEGQEFRVRARGEVSQAPSGSDLRDQFLEAAMDAERWLAARE